PRPQTLKKVIQAAVASGVKNFYFINTRKVEKSYWNSPLLESGALEPHVVLGLEQGGDTVMPKLNFRRSFRDFAEKELGGIVGDSLALAAHPEAAQPCPAQVDGPVTLVVGPEGGFTDYEIGLLTRCGCLPVHLGKRPLRTEFALCALLGRILFL
ncbi:MAG: RsmE family RNA methyltransferase, partial [Victivallales bacterium]|nr:RsmE family RNA methyltransferase [Victivallales bacterium]